MIFVRRATVSDTAAISQCVSDLSLATRPTPRTGTEEDDTRPGGDPCDVYVAEHAGEFAGVLVLRTTDGAIGIEMVATCDAGRRAGCERVLLRHARACATRLGADKIYLDTGNDSFDARLQSLAMAEWETGTPPEGGGRRAILLRRRTTGPNLPAP